MSLLTLFRSRPIGSATVLLAGVQAAAAVGTCTATGTGSPAIADAGGWPGAWPRPTADAAVRVTGVQARARLGRLVGAGTVDDELLPLVQAVRALVARYDEHEQLLRQLAATLHALVKR